jgi:transcriptional regulator with XRE-family HTH domain
MTHVSTATDIGSAISAARKAKRLTQSQLATLADVHQPKISAIESGKDTAHVGIVLRIIKALGLTIDLIDATAPTKRPEQRAAETLLDEPLPDASIDLDAIVDRKAR